MFEFYNNREFLLFHEEYRVQTEDFLKIIFLHYKDENHQHLFQDLFFRLFFAYQYDLGEEVEQVCLKLSRHC